MFRRVPVLLALAGLLAVAPLAHANTVRLTDITTGDFATNASGGGGPFLATTTGTLLGAQSFVTFCLEINETFNWNTNYNFTLSDAAVLGGAGGGNPDPVSDATKWLYYQVISGGYTAFASVFGTGSGVGARVQQAIWFLEDEVAWSQISTGAQSLVTFALTQDWTSLFNAGHRVYAMNLTTSSGARVQDQLAYVQVPEPGSLLILGLGFLGAGAMLRRRHA